MPLKALYRRLCILALICCRASVASAKGIASFRHECSRLNTRHPVTFHRYSLSVSHVLFSGRGVRHQALAIKSSAEDILSALGLNAQDAVTVLRAASAADTEDAVRNITGAQVYCECAHDLSGWAIGSEAMPGRVHLCRWMQSRVCLRMLVCLRGIWGSCYTAVLSF